MWGRGAAGSAGCLLLVLEHDVVSTAQKPSTTLPRIARFRIATTLPRATGPTRRHARQVFKLYDNPEDRDVTTTLPYCT